MSCISLYLIYIYICTIFVLKWQLGSSRGNSAENYKNSVEVKELLTACTEYTKKFCPYVIVEHPIILDRFKPNPIAKGLPSELLFGEGKGLLLVFSVNL